MLNKYPIPSAIRLHTLSEKPFSLQSGVVLDKVTIAYQTFGERAMDDKNVVLVFHALSGNTDCLSWWPGLTGAGKLIDPAHDFILCANFLGSCYGSTGPDDILWPEITIRDIARSQFQLLVELGIRNVHLAIGGSMGAMVLLELALLNREAGSPIRFDRCAVIAASAEHSAWRVAFSSTIRRTIERFGESTGFAGYQEGLRLARQFAMISYRSSEEFDTRFGRSRTNDRFSVESYLEHQGDKIAERFSPFSYTTLTRAMELFDLTAGRTEGPPTELLSALGIPILFIGISSDILYKQDEIRALADSIPNATYKHLDAPYGHDSFLIVDGATEHRLAEIIAEFINADLECTINHSEVDHAD